MRKMLAKMFKPHSRSWLLLTFLFCIFILVKPQTTSTTCTEYQFQHPVTNECISTTIIHVQLLIVECNNILFGCRSCSYSGIAFQDTTVQGLQCNECDYGLYLLKFSNSTSLETQTNILTMCIPSCEDFSHNYVSNPNNRQCEFCGKQCTKCSLKDGCTDCYLNDHGGTLTSQSYPSASFPYSLKQPGDNFQTCQNCSTLYTDSKNRCDKCSTYNTTYCDSCYGFIGSNVAGDTSCKLCNNGNLTNCIQCNSANTTQCLNCANGYYVNNKTFACASCTTGEGCLRCNATQINACLECQKEYVYNSTTKGCDKCLQTKSLSLQTYEIMGYRCSQCQFDQLSKAEQCAYCDIGFMNSTSTVEQIVNPNDFTCRLKCGDHQYPEVTFQSPTTLNKNENLISKTICRECPLECVRCSGPNSAAQCTECSSTQVLRIIDPVRMTGQCVDKTTLPGTIPNQFDIYVANSLGTSITASVSQRSGTLNSPFIDLNDALTRAKEIASQYTTTIKITIQLYAGTHYLLRNRGDPSQIYTPQLFYDPLNLNYELTIKALSCNSTLGIVAPICGESATLINKRRDGFLIDVPVKLTLKGVTIDSLDSILPVSAECLNQNRTCCQISSDTSQVSNVDPSDTVTDCAKAFTDLQLTMNCYINQPRTMFRMRINNRNEISQPNQLIIDSSEVRNIYYDMNSIINMTEFGGIITITNSVFQRISICGSLIKNFYAPMPAPDLSFIQNSSLLCQYQKDFLVKLRRIQMSYFNSFQQKTNPVRTLPFNCGGALGDCFKLTISGSLFSYFASAQNTQKSLNLVNAANGLQYQGNVINVIDFKGEIRVQDSTFQDNRFAYDGCDNILPSLSESPSAISSVNNFNQLFNPSSQYNLYQIKSLISIMKHSRQLLLLQNVFKGNVALKGIINIEISEQNQYPLIVNGNSFVNNSAIIESNVLNIRKANSQNLLGTTYTMNEQLMCGGIEISQNSFNGNIGCGQRTIGAIRVYCFDNSLNQPSGIIKYTGSIDTQDFIGDSGDVSLLSFNINNLNFAYFTDKYTSSKGLPSADFKVNMQALTMTGNSFISNFAGHNTSIVQVQGFPLVFMKNELYSNNMNYISNAFKDYSPLYALQSDKSIPLSIPIITQSIFDAYPIKAQSIITIVRALVVKLSGVQFDSNYVFDQTTASGNYYPQANSVLLIDFYGNATINEGSMFQNYQGLRGLSYIQQSKISIAIDILDGIKTDLIRFHRSKFSILTLNGIQTQNNAALISQTYVSLISFSSMKMSLAENIPILENIYASNFVVANNYSMFKIDMINFTLTNSVFESITISGSQSSGTGGRLVVARMSVAPNGEGLALFKNISVKQITNNGIEPLFVIDQSQVKDVMPDIANGNFLKNHLYVTFDTLLMSDIVNINAPSVVRFQGLSEASLLINHKLVLTVVNCTFKNQPVQPNFKGIYHIASQKLSGPEAFTLEFNLTQSQFLDNSGSLLYLENQELQSAKNIQFRLYVSHMKITNSASTIIKMNNLALTSTALDVQIHYNLTNLTVASITQGHLISIDNTLINAARIINESLQFNLSSIDTVQDQLINLGARQYKSISNQHWRTLLLDYITSTDVQREFLSLNDFSLTNSNGNFYENITVRHSIFKMVKAQAPSTNPQSLFYFGKNNATLSGNYDQYFELLNSTFTNFSRSSGCFYFPPQYINSQLSSSRIHILKDSEFTLQLKGHALMSDQIQTITQGAQLYSVSMQTCSFTNFASGSAYAIGNLDLQANQGKIEQTFSISKGVFTNFQSSTNPVISLGVIANIVGQQSSFSNSFTIENSKFNSIENACIKYPVINANTYGSQTFSTDIRSSQFEARLAEALLIQEMNIESTNGDMHQTINIGIGSLFTYSKGYPIDIRNSQRTSAGMNSLIMVIGGVNFLHLEQGAIKFGQMYYFKSLNIVKSISLTSVQFTNSSGNVIHNSGMLFQSAPNAVVQDDLLIKFGSFSDIKASIYFENPYQMVDPVQSINHSVSIEDLPIDSSGSLPSLDFSSSNFNAISSITSRIAVINVLLNGLSTSALSIAQRSYQSNGPINVHVDLQDSRIWNKTVSALSQAPIIFKDSTRAISNITILKTQFESLATSGIKLDTIISSTATISQQIVNISGCTFKTIKSNAIILNPFGTIEASKQFRRTLNITFSEFIDIQNSAALLYSPLTFTGPGTFAESLNLTSLAFKENTNSLLYFGKVSLQTAGSIEVNNTFREIQALSLKQAPIIYEERKMISSESSARYQQSFINAFFNLSQGNVISRGPVQIQALGGRAQERLRFFNSGFNYTTGSCFQQNGKIDISSSNLANLSIEIYNSTFNVTKNTVLQLDSIALLGNNDVNFTLVTDNSSFSTVQEGGGISISTLNLTSYQQASSFINVNSSNMTSLSKPFLSISQRIIQSAGQSLEQLTVNSSIITTFSGDAIQLGSLQALYLVPTQGVSLNTPKGSYNYNGLINNSQFTGVQGKALVFSDFIANYTLTGSFNSQLKILKAIFTNSKSSTINFSPKLLNSDSGFVIDSLEISDSQFQQQTGEVIQMGANTINVGGPLTWKLSIANMLANQLTGKLPVIYVQDQSFSSKTGAISIISTVASSTFSAITNNEGSIFQVPSLTMQSVQGSVNANFAFSATTFTDIKATTQSPTNAVISVSQMNSNSLADYTFSFSVSSKSTFKNLNQLSAIIINDKAAISSTGSINSLVDISSTTFQGITKGQGVIINRNDLAGANKYTGTVTITDSTFHTITTYDYTQGAVQIETLNIGANIIQNQITLTTTIFNGIRIGSAILIDASSLRGQSVSNIATLDQSQILSSSTNNLALVIFKESEITSDNQNSQLNIIKGKFNYNSGSQLTSCIYVNDNYQGIVGVTITESSFINNAGKITNEIYFESIKSIVITNNQWRSDIEADTLKSRFLYRGDNGFHVTVTGSSFNCTENAREPNSVLAQGYEAEIIHRVSLFVLYGPASDNPRDYTKGNDLVDQFSKNQYYGCLDAYKGAVFNLEHGAMLTDSNSDYYKNSAYKGGVAYLSGIGTRLTISTPSQIISSNVAYYGALVFAEEHAQVFIDNAKIQSNNAIEGAIAFLSDNAFINLGPSIIAQYNTVYKRGLIVIMMGSTFNIVGALIDQNTAYQGSVFVYASNVKSLTYAEGNFGVGKLTPIKVSLQNNIIDCTLQKNEVFQGGRLITIQDASLYINNTLIQKNDFTDDTLGIFASQVSLTIENSIFLNDQRSSYFTQFDNKKIGDINGAFLSIGRNSTVYLTNTTYRGGRGLYGGCIYLQGNSYLYIQNSVFTTCVGLLGGAIYAANYESLVVTDSIFEQNIVFRGFSQNIFTQTSKGNMTLIRNSFKSYHNSIFFRDGNLLYMEDNTFLPEDLRVSEIPLQEYAGGLHIINTRSITFKGSNIFSGLQGANGGGIYFHLDLNFKSLKYILKYEIYGLQISNCVATSNGGGMYLSNIQNMTLFDTIIENNKALTGEGGGIQFHCNESIKFDCSLTLRDSTEIRKNVARIGGGIRWNWKKPVIDSMVGASVWGNTGLQYGADFASFAREVVLIQNESDYLRYFDRVNLQQNKLQVDIPFINYTYDSVQSGGYIPARYFALIDDEKQVVTTDSGSQISFKALKQTIGIFNTEITGVTKFFSAFGVFNVSGMKLVCAPNSTQYMNMTVVDAVDLNKPSVLEYLKNAYSKNSITPLKTFKDYLIGMKLRVRSCVKGEGLKPDGQCFACATGTYLLFEPEVGVPTECKSCPMEKAICLGGTKIGPRPGYWRKNNITDKFLECKVESACLGMVAPRMLDVGECAEGYHGALCSGCLPGYARSKKYGCGACPDPVLNTLRISGILVVVIIVIGILVRNTLLGATKKNLQSVYMKIFMNHLQLLAICASFNFSWPPAISTFFESGNSVMSATDVLFSFDCQMDNRVLSEIDHYQFQAGDQEMRIVFQKLFMMGALPLLIAFIVTIFWWIVLKKRRQIEQLETKLIATLVIIFFLVHPKITQAMVDMYNCQDFDGDLRLIVDLQVVCWEGLHPLIALGVALPCLIAWGLGIPAGVWVLMNRDRERLDTVAVKEKFGFLYNGYKRSSFFWEIVIMYRKITMIGISVFMNRIGLIVQALVLLITMVAFLQLNNMRRPFASRTLNDIEDLSLMTGIVTIYCGIFFITSRNSKQESFNPSTDFELPDWGGLAIFAIIIFANLAFVGTWGVKYISIIRAMIKEKQPKIYLCLFLCCREDKLQKEAEELAKDAKRENIIEKIEEVQFFFKHMKKLYERSANFEGHSRFLSILYHIESEKGQIDLTEKKHHFQVKGKMARDRKLDPQRMREILDEHILELDPKVVGDDLSGLEEAYKQDNFEEIEETNIQDRGSKLSKIREIIDQEGMIGRRKREDSKQQEKLKQRIRRPSILKKTDEDEFQKVTEEMAKRKKKGRRVSIKPIMRNNFQDQQETALDDPRILINDQSQDMLLGEEQDEPKIDFSGGYDQSSSEIDPSTGLIIDKSSGSSLKVFEDLIPFDLRRKARVIRQQQEQGGEQAIRSRNALATLKKHRKKKPIAASQSADNVVSPDKKGNEIVNDQLQKTPELGKKDSAGESPTLKLEGIGSPPRLGEIQSEKEHKPKEPLRSEDQQEQDSVHDYFEYEDSDIDNGDASVKNLRMARRLTYRLGAERAQANNISLKAERQNLRQQQRERRRQKKEQKKMEKERRIFNVNAQTNYNPDGSASRSDYDSSRSEFSTRLVQMILKKHTPRTRKGGIGEETKGQMTTHRGIDHDHQRLVSIGEVKKLSKQGKEWRQGMRITGRLRPDFIPRDNDDDLVSEDDYVRAFSRDDEGFAGEVQQQQRLKNDLFKHSRVKLLDKKKGEDEEDQDKLVVQLDELIYGGGKPGSAAFD